MSTTTWVDSLFATIDRKDTEAFVSLIEEDGVFKFGNWPEARGTAAITETVGGFFAGINGLSHNVKQVWDVRSTTIVEGEVTYTRLDGTTLTVPFANILRRGSDKISEYKIFADVNELFS